MKGLCEEWKEIVCVCFCVFFCFWDEVMMTIALMLIVVPFSLVMGAKRSAEGR